MTTPGDKGRMTQRATASCHAGGEPETQECVMTAADCLGGAVMNNIIYIVGLVVVVVAVLSFFGLR
jgi:hypothetical protein